MNVKSMKKIQENNFWSIKCLINNTMSDDIWEQYLVQNKKLEKQVGLYEIESIDNPNILTIFVNPKEHFEKYRDQSVNKKQKDLKKDTLGMDFEACSHRLSSLHEFCNKQKPKNVKQK